MSTCELKRDTYEWITGLKRDIWYVLTREVSEEISWCTRGVAYVETGVFSWFVAQELGPSVLVLELIECELEYISMNAPEKFQRISPKIFTKSISIFFAQ